MPFPTLNTATNPTNPTKGARQEMVALLHSLGVPNAHAHLDKLLGQVGAPPLSGFRAIRGSSSPSPQEPAS